LGRSVEYAVFTAPIAYDRVPSMITISYLADYPDYLSTVSAWVYGEWGEHMPGLTVGDLTRIFSGHLNRDRIPLTLIAFLDGQPAGTASIYVHDMDTRPDLSPWLAAVYVAPPYRKQGLGSALVKAIESAAQQLQISRLYLFTPDQEHFYTRLGWSVLERVAYRNQTVVVMEKFMR
jgi:GNAT superfamily N-acetyltransferase